jgi:hypothetical protein
MAKKRTQPVGKGASESRRRNGSTKPTKKPQSLAAIYARARREFTAADLQQYTDIGETLPFRPLLAELEQTQHREPRKRR